MSPLSKIKSQVENFRVVPPTDSHSDPPSHTHQGQRPEKDEEHSTPQQQDQKHQPTLEITSYNRFTPPNPKPDFEYDCRMTKNPARQTRHIHTGLDSSVQDELTSRDEFNDLIDRAEGDIRKLMEVKEARAKGQDDTAVVRVGCLCGSGHHRSVAFAEQLGKIEWPGEWSVRVNHRDLTDGVREEKREKERDAVAGAKARKVAEGDVEI